MMTDTLAGLLIGAIMFVIGAVCYGIGYREGKDDK